MVRYMVLRSLNHLAVLNLSFGNLNLSMNGYEILAYVAICVVPTPITLHQPKVYPSPPGFAF